MATTYLTRTGTTPTTSNKYTFSCWIKRGSIGTTETLFRSYSDGSNSAQLIFDSDDTFAFQDIVGGTTVTNLKPSNLFRDTGAWMNIIVQVDYTQAAAADRAKIFINGEEVSYSATTRQSQNGASNLNTAANNAIGSNRSNSSHYFTGSMSQVNFIDGTAYPATTFGSVNATSGIWKANSSPTVTYGNNGFFLDMANSSDMGNDVSGKANDFTVGGGILTQMQDTPDNNFATMNPLARYYSDTSSLSNGNNTYSITSYTLNARSTIAMPSGKWYWEVKQSADNCRLGVCTSGFNPNIDTDDAGAYYGGSTGFGGVYIMNTGPSTNWQITNNNTSKNVTTYTNGVATVANTILSVAVDVDAGKLWVGVNGTWLYSGDPAAGSGEQIAFTNSSPDPLQAFIGFNSVNARVAQCNFGNGFFGVTAVASSNADAAGHGLFEYAVPTGYFTLNTKNLNTYGT